MPGSGPRQYPTGQVSVPEQALQAAPTTPQAEVEVPGRQVVPEQQPLQEAESQVQLPFTQCCPAAQGPLLPHAHAPAVQRSERRPQATQAPPLIPQVVTVAALQVAPEQQPAGQMAEVQPLHTPPVQVCGLGQVSQAAPPAPQADGEVPAWQLLLEQQPTGQDVASQTHLPAEQRWPAAHAPVLPQWHVPSPSEQLSERFGSQTTQPAPKMPHAFTEGEMQALPAQHPVGQELASQTHLPSKQRWPTPHTGPSPQRCESPLLRSTVERSASDGLLSSASSGASRLFRSSEASPASVRQRPAGMSRTQLQAVKATTTMAAGERGRWHAIEADDSRPAARG
jgi:hypothetical protein